jgi:hypothetical protein
MNKLSIATLATVLLATTPTLAQTTGFCANEVSTAYNIVTIPGNPPHQVIQWVTRTNTFGPYPTLAKAYDVALSLLDIMTSIYKDPKYIGEFTTFGDGQKAAVNAFNFNKPYTNQFNMWTNPC